MILSYGVVQFPGKVDRRDFVVFAALLFWLAPPGARLPPPPQLAERSSVVSTRSDALHGAENCDTYAIDDKTAGDEWLAEFFHEAWSEQIHLAERAKELLGLPVDTTTPHTAEVGTSIPPEDPTGSEALRTPREARRGPAPEPPPTTGYATREEPLPAENEPLPGDERLPEDRRAAPPPPDPHRTLTHQCRAASATFLDSLLSVRKKSRGAVSCF